MDGVGIVFCVIGVLIFISSFMIRFKKSTIEEDLKDAIREFEKENGGEENEPQAQADDFDSDDMEFRIIMASSKSFFRFIGGSLFIVGIIIYVMSL